MTKRQTQVMRNAGTWEEFSWDQLGRVTARKRNAGGTLTQLYALVWDVPIPGTSCPTAVAARVLGRLGYRDDTFGRTGYSYDPEGRVLVEWRQRMGSTAQWVNNASSLANHPSTTYVYSANGNLTSIRYPHGRTVNYVYGTGGRADRVVSITATPWTGSAWGTATTLLEQVEWEPYAALRSYRFAVGGTAAYNQFTVGRALWDGAAVSNACSATLPADSSDGTGRLGGISVAAELVATPAPPTHVGYVMRKHYEWVGEQVTAEKTCFPLASGPSALFQSVQSSQAYAYDKTGQLTQESRGAMPALTHGYGGTPLSTVAATAYTLSPRGNRTGLTVDNCPRSISFGAAGQQDLLSSMGPNGSAGCQLRTSATSYETDADGRVARMATAWWWYYADFGFDDPTHAGLDSVFHSVTINRLKNWWSGYTSSTYEYFYDAFNRRRAKVLPNGTVHEFFYDTEHDLLTELTPSSVFGASSYAGRYLSPAPLLQSPGYVRTMAARGMQVPTYAYAANNPLMYVDPDGRGIRAWSKAFALAMKLYSERKIRKVPEKLDEAHEVVKKNKKKKGGQCGGGDPPDDPDFTADDFFDLVLPDLPVFNPELVESVMDMPFRTADPGTVY